MENPNTWDEIDKDILTIISKYEADSIHGVYGLSLGRRIGDYIRERYVNMTLERGKPSPMEYYHDIHCNADSFQPQGCYMCSCWQPRAEKAEAKLLALESALWKIIDDGNIESFAFKVAEEALSKNFHKEPRV